MGEYKSLIPTYYNYRHIALLHHNNYIYNEALEKNRELE